MSIQIALHTTVLKGSEDRGLSFTPKLQAPTGVSLGRWLFRKMIRGFILFSLLVILGRFEFHTRLTLALLVFLLLCGTVQCPSDGSGCREAVSMGIVRTSPHGVHN